MDPQLRTFSVQEVNQLIPILTPLLIELQGKQKQAIDLETQIDALELISEPGGESTALELNRLVKRHHARVTEFYAIADEIHSHGCLLKDVELGLIDFYAMLDGKTVYLCWKLGEGKVGHWHEVGKGYAAREPISPSSEIEGKGQD